MKEEKEGEEEEKDEIMERKMKRRKIMDLPTLDLTVNIQLNLIYSIRFSRVRPHGCFLVSFFFMVGIFVHSKYIHSKWSQAFPNPNSH